MSAWFKDELQKFTFLALALAMFLNKSFAALEKIQSTARHLRIRMKYQ